MRVLVTGAAGFIGSALSLKLVSEGHEVLGLDNHNDYYDPSLKEMRLHRLNGVVNYSHVRGNIADKDFLNETFSNFNPSRVVNLAAQAGVRYSLENPSAYLDSNLVGFGNILEACRVNQVEHLIYASSSSVYGANTKMPYSPEDAVDHPLSLYAATKKANELMAHSYSHLYGLPTTGLRFFTVYGPWDRPDMALQKFAMAIKRGEAIKIYNHGSHKRDFTFIDDVVEGVFRVIRVPAVPDPSWKSDQPSPGSSDVPWRIYNLGNGSPVRLSEYITHLEQALGRTAEKEYLPKQPGDVDETYADASSFIRDFHFRPRVGVEEGIRKFAAWFSEYYG